MTTLYSKFSRRNLGRESDPKTSRSRGGANANGTGKNTSTSGGCSINLRVAIEQRDEGVLSGAFEDSVVEFATIYHRSVCSEGSL